MATVITYPNLRISLMDLRDQGSIALVDLSAYLSIPSTGDYTLQITAPGWPTISVPFEPTKVNIYRCADLGITCESTECCPLPDGIYNVVYTVRSGTTTTRINKTFIKVDQLDCRIANLFLKIDLECDCSSLDQRKFKQQVKEIELLREGAVAAANDCDDLLAYKLYAMANSQIDAVYSKFCSSCSPIPYCDQCN